MKAYVLGAGVSRNVGYPIGTGLFDAIDEYVRDSGNLIDRFDYREDWNQLHRWLDTNVNPTIVQAYHTKNIEHLFTVLDFAAELLNDALLGVYAARGTEEGMARSDRYDVFKGTIEDYRRYRRILLRALEHYFSWRHSENYESSGEGNWDSLRAFGETLEPGDAIITFNYDATLERVLLGQGKWSPSDGMVLR